MQGALLALDVKTGAVRAMVGGSDFERSKFNRATQAMRQVGSAFKPFVYAAAIERAGLHPRHHHRGRAHLLPRQRRRRVVAPQLRLRVLGPDPGARAPSSRAATSPPSRPSRRWGSRPGIEYAHKLGLTGELPPYLPLALGAGEATLTEMTAAYAAFANQGLRMKPYLITRITDRDGNIIEEGAARGQGRDPRRHRLHHDQPAARRGAARHRGPRVAR